MAVTSKGDVLEWGTGFDESTSIPQFILKSHNIKSVQISRGRIYAVSKSGDKLLSIATSKAEQLQEQKTGGASKWFFSKTSPRQVKIPMQRGENIKQISAGEKHILILTTNGRVFSSATGSHAQYSSEGQLGIPVLLDDDSSILPEDPHEISTLRGIRIAQIAAGANHSIARTEDGKVWVFGSNLYGQLGMDYSINTAFIPIPALLALDRLYNTRGEAKVACSSIAAGGDTSLFTVTNYKKQTDDLWVSGSGLHGQHGSGHYAHTLGTPQRIKSLCNLPILSISVGKRHLAAVIDTHSESSDQRQLMFWGGNDWFQLGNGKRSNIALPSQLKTDNVVSKSTSKFEETVVCGNLGTALYWRRI